MKKTVSMVFLLKKQWKNALTAARDLSNAGKTKRGRGGVVPVERYLVLGCHGRIAAARTFRASKRRGIDTAVATAAAAAAAAAAARATAVAAAGSR